jgi:SAM-dependent methyltransferase
MLQSRFRSVFRIRNLGILLVPAALALVAAGTGLANPGRKPDKPKKLGQTFNEIYEKGSWSVGPDGKGTSGSGSTLGVTGEYRAFLAEFIKSHDIKSVVDAGCGDWEFSSSIDWNHARYLGVDISTTVIEAVKRKYENETTKFKVGDVTDSLPPADLLVCKDVLQHLPNALIKKFIRNNLRKGKYKWAIITNDRGPENPDIHAGDYRYINLSAPPFSVKRLVDLPVVFDGAPNKIAELLDLR